MLNEEAEEPSPEERRMETKTAIFRALQVIILQSFQNHPGFQKNSTDFMYDLDVHHFFISSRVSRYHNATKARPNLGEDSASLAKRGAELEVHSLINSMKLDISTQHPKFLNRVVRQSTVQDNTKHLRKNSDSDCDPLRCHTLGQQVFIVGPLLSIAWPPHDPTIDYKQIQPDPKGRSL